MCQGLAGLGQKSRLPTSQPSTARLFFEMFGEKADSVRFFTKHLKNFCCLQQQKRAFKKP